MTKRRPVDDGLTAKAQKADFAFLVKSKNEVGKHIDDRRQ